MENTTATSNDLRYPIGKFDPSRVITPEIRAANVAAIRDLPGKIEAAIAGLSDGQLDTEYRPEGWTVRQTVHHVADSHINSFCRFKLALTEDVPTIRPYAEARWAELADSLLPLDSSLAIIRGVHHRLHILLESLSDADFERELIHPDSGQFSVDRLLALYAWHGAHHVAHIAGLRERNGW
ncbi:MAG: putative metal-dependent hydrolase [Acidobacteria bacterium]|nr:putative metal-dependent hydrolase [Acidobacteriota bacterium]